MRGIGFRLIVATLTFMVGLAADRLASSFRDSPTIGEHTELSITTFQPAGPESHGLLMTGEMLSRDGHRIAFTSFQLPNGQGLERQSLYFDSAERANSEFMKALGRATRTVSLAHDLKHDGNDLGMMAVAKFRAHDQYGPAAIVWTDGSALRYLRGDSFAKLEELAKDRQLVRCLPWCLDWLAYPVNPAQ